MALTSAPNLQGSLYQTACRNIDSRESFSLASSALPFEENGKTSKPLRTHPDLDPEDDFRLLIFLDHNSEWPERHGLTDRQFDGL